MKLRMPTIGEMLKEEFMDPANLSAYELAKSINVPVSRIQDIIHDRRRITADTSIRLGKYFGMSEQFFLNLQNNIDLRNAKMKMGNEIDEIIPYNNNRDAV